MPCSLLCLLKCTLCEITSEWSWNLCSTEIRSGFSHLYGSNVDTSCAFVSNFLCVFCICGSDRFWRICYKVQTLTCHYWFGYWDEMQNHWHTSNLEASLTTQSGVKKTLLRFWQKTAECSCRQKTFCQYCECFMCAVLNDISSEDIAGKQVHATAKTVCIKAQKLLKDREYEEKKRRGGGAKANNRITETSKSLTL